MSKSLQMRRTATSGVLVSLGFAACFSSSACALTSSNHPSVVGQSVETPCGRAALARARIPELLSAGKLDRTIRVIRHADSLCPDKTAATWDVLLQTLADVGREDEARELAKQIENSRDKTESSKAAAKRIVASFAAPIAGSEETILEARAAFSRGATARGEKRFAEAKKEFLQAWTLSRPNGRALYWAGMVAREMGEKVEAQRLFDRAIVEFERTTGKPVTVGNANPKFAAGWGDVAAWSRDGRWFAIAGGEFISIRDRYLDFAEVQTLGPYTTQLYRVAISPDGNFVAGIDQNSAFMVYRRSPRTEAISLQVTEESRGGPLAFSPDNKTLALGLQYFELATGKRIPHAEETEDENGRGYSPAASAIAFSPNGKQVAAGQSYGNAQLWELAAKTPLHQFTNQQWTNLGYSSEDKGRSIEAITFSPDGRTIAAGAEADFIFLWDVMTEELKGILRHGSGGSRHFQGSLVYSPDGKKLASSMSAPHALRIFDLEHGTTLDIDTRGPGVLSFARDGQTISSGQLDGTIHEFDSSTGQRRSDVGLARCYAENGAFSPDGNTLAVSCSDSRIHLWNTIDGSTRLRPGHPTSVYNNSLAYTSTDRHLKQISMTSREMLIRDVETGKTQSLAIPLYSNWVAIAPDGETVLQKMGSSLQLTKIGSPPRLLGADIGNAQNFIFSPNSLFVAAEDAGPSIRVWDVRSGAEISKLEGHQDNDLRRLFSNRGEMFVASYTDGTLRLWNVTSGKQIRQWDHAQRPAFSPDDKTLAFYDGSAICLWDLTQDREIRRIPSRLGAVARFSPDGKWLLIDDDSSSGIHFLAVTGKSAFTLRFVEERNGAVIFSPDDVPFIDSLGMDLDAAGKTLRCNAGGESYSFDLCREHFEVPGLFAKLRAGDPSYADP